MNKYIASLIIALCCFSFSFSQDYKTHKVKTGETIESIAKTYLVTPFDIYALNPDAKIDLQPNTVLIIPKSRVTGATQVTQEKTVSGYKKHKVKRKETLFSISQKYNVSIEEIKKHNKRLYSENLRKGDKIQIPEYKTTLVESNVLENTIKKYIVQPKEGKWRIAYKFGITVDELSKLNPKMGDVLQPGDELNVPNIADNEEKAVDEDYGYYTVLPKEGFYRLKIKLGLSQSQLEDLNPELREGGLQILTSETCRAPEYWGDHKDLHDRVFCAHDLERKTCVGDSGGPVVQGQRLEDLTLVGISSWGSVRCAADGKPGVYTRIASHADWIKRVIGADLPESVASPDPVSP